MNELIGRSLILCILSTHVHLLYSLQFVQQWDTFEVCMKGPQQSPQLNPFVDVILNASFTSDLQSIVVNGFYDANGEYCVRFMPTRIGKWSFLTDSNVEELKGKVGELECIESGGDNHGPVSVHNTYHFSYSDRTKYIEMGTTVYGLPFLSNQRINETLETLKSSPFNKIRICLLPIEEMSNLVLVPYQLTQQNTWNFSLFNASFFQRLDSIVTNLRDLNIEADVILLNPYFSKYKLGDMTVADDQLMVSYVISRLSAYRNVWWSAANEYDLIANRTVSDWDRIGAQIQKQDPYNHLRSIHFSIVMYNPCKEWVTHNSAQNGHAVADFGRAVLYRDVCPKPVVYDEVYYEGNHTKRWGQLTAQQMTLRFWMAAIAGTYVGHGEVLGDIQYTWLLGGGTLRGHSAPRIAFLKSILENASVQSIDAIDPFYENNFGGVAGQYYLVYFGEQSPDEWTFQLIQNGVSDGMRFRVDILDTWNMTITPLNREFTLKRHDSYYYRSQSNATIQLPSAPYIALQITRIN